MERAAVLVQVPAQGDPVGATPLTVGWPAVHEGCASHIVSVAEQLHLVLVEWIGVQSAILQGASNAARAHGRMEGSDLLEDLNTLNHAPSAGNAFKASGFNWTYSGWCGGFGEFGRHFW